MQLEREICMGCCRCGKFRWATGAALLLMLLCVSGVVHAGVGTVNDLFDISFANEKDGWSCGRWGTVLRTSDGGRTWTAQESGTDYTLSSIFFVDTVHGWAVGDEGTILHTDDGGATWNRQVPPDVNVQTARRWGDTGWSDKKKTKPLTSFLMGVHFADARTGWIVTERTTILNTVDGGKTWSVQFSDEDFVLRSISFCDDTHGWAVGEYGYIYHTHDGGKTWEHQAGYFDISEETGELIGENFLFDVAAVSPKRAWVVGIDGFVSRTDDGGKTWQRITEGVPKTHLFGICATDTDTVLISGNALLLYSRDGGASFSRATADPAITYGWLYDITARGRAGFAAAGKEGWIYLTGKEIASWKLGGN